MLDPVQQIVEAEAHLYVGIAKADGVISQNEYAQIPYYAAKSQRFFDLMQMNKETQKRIGEKIQMIMTDKSWEMSSPSDHLHEAIRILKEAKNDGNWQFQVVYTKNEEGFIESAKIDGYVIKESLFISEMKSALEELSER